MSTGEGNSNLERYYFDQQSKACRPFVYNGLKGNQNNFISLVGNFGTFKNDKIITHNNYQHDVEKD